MRRYLLGLAVLLLLLGAGPAWMTVAGGLRFDQRWFEAGRAPAGLVADPAADGVARVQVYAARAFNWRGIFAVHTWIATKPAGRRPYTIRQVTRWGPTPGAERGRPDRQWFGNEPVMLAELTGAAAERAIPAVAAAAAAYPHAGRYRVWPGPNSNTFTAWVIRRVPGLDAALPPTAIGKDYLAPDWTAMAPSGTGVQFSAGGYAGVLLGLEEGLEINLLGAVIGIDPTGPALLLPGVGRVGFGRR